MSYKDKEKELKNKKEYYIKNKEKILKRMRLYGKKWYKDNKEKIQKIHREYYWNNKEKESERHKIIYTKNKEEILERSRKYYLENIEKIRERHRKYNTQNRKKLLEYKGEWQKKQRKTNPRYKLNENMGSAIARSLKGIKSGHPWQELVNYTLEDLTKHLEKKFDKKMSWENYGTYWSVDHIKPKSLFTYVSTEDPQFNKCWDLDNLQPLEKIENIKKRNRYIIIK